METNTNISFPSLEVEQLVAEEITGLFVDVFANLIANYESIVAN